MLLSTKHRLHLHVKPPERKLPRQPTTSRTTPVWLCQQTSAPVARNKAGGAAHHGAGAWHPHPSQLYEEHFRLPIFKKTVTSKEPELQRMVMMLWSIELRFRVLAHCVTRVREHKQPQFEKDAAALARDFGFLSDHIDELREEAEPSRAQDGDWCPVVLGPSHSQGLTSLLAAAAAVSQLSPAERKSVSKSVLHVTAAYSASFQHMGTGLGIEHQLNDVLRALDLPATVPVHRQNFDYASLVQQGALECMLAEQGHFNAEHYFFRASHVIIEAWVHVINTTLRSVHPIAQAGQWDEASWQMLKVARMVEHAGDQYQALQSMCMADFYELRVLVDGLSGTGSTQVMSIKRLILKLLAPFSEKAKQIRKGLSCSEVVHIDCEMLAAFRLSSEQRDALQAAVQIYASPAQYAGLYRYARALETLESAVLGGFFFKHYALVVNVIGSGIKQHAVPHLKHTYEQPLFPLLNAARSLLADRVEGDMGPLKGRAVEEIIQNFKDGTTVAAQVAEAVEVVDTPAAAQTAPADASTQKRSKCPFLQGL